MPNHHDDHDDAHDHGHDDHAHHHHVELTYEEEILDFRATKDEFFRTSHQSPIPHERRHGFGGLRYYPPDPRYRLDGLAVAPDPDATNTAEIVTSDGKTRVASRVGTLEFDVPGGHATLTGYSFGSGAVESLFVPFRDATSGGETYGAGRYLDLELEDDGTYVLDFNLAYNPWCAYAAHYSCPLPPRENWLPIAIAAGEQVPLEEPGA